MIYNIVLNQLLSSTSYSEDEPTPPPSPRCLPIDYNALRSTVASLSLSSETSTPSFFPFFALPLELRLHTLSFLDLPDVLLASPASRGWKELLDDEMMWRKSCQRVFGHARKPENDSWRTFMIANAKKWDSMKDDSLEIRLLWAAENGHDCLLRRFLLKDQKPNPSLPPRKKNKFLLKGAYKGHREVVNVLLSEPHLASIEAATRSGFTPLHMACGKGHVEVLQTLIAHGAFVESRNRNGSTPLHTAAQKGHAHAVEALIKHKANIEATNNNGVTPLNSASHKGHVEVVRCLLRHGALMEATNKNGITPLYSAAHRGHLEVVQCLLEANANIEGTTKNHGATPLYISAQEGFCEIVELLLKHNANVEAKIWSGMRSGATALYTAAHRGHVNIVDLLLRHGANTEVADRNGCTPLYKACQEGHTEVVEVLLRAGANPRVRAADNTTPQDVATKAVRRVLKDAMQSDCIMC
eukprot:TRINITY_DN1265_c0_g1_i4.p1 TRINITY_DN1265_c0_g1~~TRINITY_DN1265_c0_g1_i4.p1  ORF type:complete len:469 (+),score=106.95 TRINITY_DN1265_c0_g1_i4:260-1666(+)